MTSPVVVDGHLTEHAELAFKATLDLAESGHRLGPVKDLIAIANSRTGGDVVVGANEDGTPASQIAVQSCG